MRPLTDRAVTVFAVGITILALAFLILPVIVAAGMSFDSRSYLASFPPNELSIRWYKEFFGEQYYLQGLWTSLILAVTSAAISTALGVCAAIAFDR